jgi:hypothetical protein
LVSRTGGNFHRILDPLTGGDKGALSGSEISGGTFPSNTIGLAGDGAIYVNNLTTQSATSPFKVCSWATEGSTPVVASQKNQKNLVALLRVSRNSVAVVGLVGRSGLDKPLFGSAYSQSSESATYPPDSPDL